MRDRLFGQKVDQSDVATGTDKKVVQEELNTAERRLVREYNAAEKLVNERTDTHATDDSRDLEQDLVKQLMDLVIKLEAESRDLLLASMNQGVARTLLLADRNGASRGNNADSSANP